MPLGNVRGVRISRHHYLEARDIDHERTALVGLRLLLKHSFYFLKIRYLKANVFILDLRLFSQAISNLGPWLERARPAGDSERARSRYLPSLSILRNAIRSLDLGDIYLPGDKNGIRAPRECGDGGEDDGEDTDEMRD